MTMSFTWNGPRIAHALYTLKHARPLAPLFEVLVAALATSGLDGEASSWSTGPNSVLLTFTDGRRVYLRGNIDVSPPVIEVRWAPTVVPMPSQAIVLRSRADCRRWVRDGCPTTR